MKTLWAGLFATALAGTLLAVTEPQDPPPAADRVAVSFTDPSRPGRIKCGVLTGGITVQGYEGKEVVIEARARASRGSRRWKEEPGATGMRRIVNSATGLSVEEENNVMQIGVGTLHRPVDITIRAPYNTALKLSSTNDGDIRVENMRGEIEVNNTNGNVALAGISGWVVAHALNGKLQAAFTEVTAGKAMSFSSLNGNIDVTFPATVKANLVMKSDNGDILSDFDIQMTTSTAKPEVEDTRSRGGRYKIKLDKAVHGTIGGGGPEFRLQTYNGNIYIRKKS